jgi:hypothetical protein
MTTSHSIKSMTTHKTGWITAALLAAVVAACGGSTQGVTGTAPSLVSPVAAGTDVGGSLGLLKEGRGKGPGNSHSPTPDLGTTPETGDAVPDLEEGHGHGNASTQYEGFVDHTLIDGNCDDGLKIPINDVVITTVEKTVFQRATCDQLLASTATHIHLHIAAKWEDEMLVATYVRMQGPKGDDGDDGDEAEDATPTTETTTN